MTDTGNGTKTRFAVLEDDIREIKNDVKELVKGFVGFQIDYARKQATQDGRIAAIEGKAISACNVAAAAQGSLRKLILILAASGVLGGGGIATLLKVLGG